MKARHDNDGLRKRCRHSRAQWPKCDHSWHFNFKIRGVSIRQDLDELVGQPVPGKTEAAAEVERLRTAFRKGDLVATRVPVLDANGDPELDWKGRRRYKVEISKRARPACEIVTVEQLLAAYLKEYIEFERSGSIDKVRSQMGAIATVVLELPTGERRAFGQWLVQDVGTGALEKFRAARRTRETVTATDRHGQQRKRRKGGKVTANRDLALLRAMFNWAIRVDYAETTPFKKSTETVVKLTKEAARRRRLEGDEAERLLKACDPLLLNPKTKAPMFPQPPARLRPVVEALLETGCRIGEILSLQWWQVKDLADGNQRLDLPASKTKTKRDRIIPISGRLQAILEMRRNDPAGEPHGPQAYVFGDEIGRRIGSIKTAWQLTCRRARIIGLRIHDLRREAGSRWLEGGVPLQVVRDWLGHKNISQTSTYLESTLMGQHEAMRRFEHMRALQVERRQQFVQPGATEGANSAVSGALELPPAAKNSKSRPNVN